jgi:hypothetical protein
MSFAKYMLPPEEEAEQRPGPGDLQSSMSLEDAIHEYVTVDARYQELALRKKRALEVLLPAAFEVRGQANVTRLTSSDQKTQIKVEFGENYKCEVDRLNTVKDLIGDDVFEGLFKTEYSPRLRTLKPFLASKSTDERIETAKNIIREAVKTTPKSPQVTIEKGRSETQF